MISRRSPHILCSRILQAGCAAAVLLGTCLLGREAHAAGLVFNVTYDSSVASAPAGFKTAFTDAVNFIEATYTDPITINMHVGWGEINGGSLSPGNLGQSLTIL